MQHNTNQDTAAQSQDILATEDEQQRYLVYSLGGEAYASPLTSIREVLKIADIKEVPYMKNYFKGVINLRGQIISVIDLREKLALQKPGQSSKGLILVVDSANGSLAVIVDDVLAVARIPEAEIDRHPILSTKIPVDFFLGVAKLNERLINMIDVSGTASDDDFSTIKRVTESA